MAMMNRERRLPKFSTAAREPLVATDEPEANQQSFLRNFGSLMKGIQIEA